MQASPDCHGHQEEIRGCQAKPCNHSSSYDCLWSQWSKWDPCSCEGFQTRSREIASKGQQGHPCLGAQKQLRPCKGICRRPTSAVDCKMNPWQSWSHCTKTCSGGQQYRSRVIVRSVAHGGRGCLGRLDETRGCFLQDCPGMMRRDCRWEDWSDWDVCSVTCGNGETTRSRVIAVQPQQGGRLCDAKQSAETARCKKAPCGNSAMQDCLWSLWQDWSPCSKSCGLGEQHRSRSIALEASHGGAGCQGVFQDFRSCEEPCPSYGQNCGFGPWTPWSDCSATCQGHHQRARSIEVQKQLGGSLCHGSLEDSRPCNEDISCITPEVDCEYQGWLAWSHCSRSRRPWPTVLWRYRAG